MSAHTNFTERTIDYNKLLHDFKQLLRENGLKFTIQREVILDMLYNSDEHLTPESLHHLIQEKHPDLNTGIATVYRTLSLLEDSEMVTSLSFGAQGKKYELGAKDHHDHIICTKCGMISEFVDDDIESRQQKIAEELGFLMQEHSMQIYGICQPCQTKMKKIKGALVTFDNQYIQQRIEKANQLRTMGIDPYANNSNRNTTIEKYHNVNSDLLHKEEKRDEHRHYTVAGRIKLYRLMGKASFIKIEDESGVLQIYVARENLPENFYNDVFKKLIEVGDIIEVSGYPFVTQQGELSLHANELTLLTKAISPLPEKFHGLQDKEMRYRQRYLDLIMNSEVRKTFHIRSKVVSLTRRFFEDKGFLEVETPMMHPIAGGANAKPFMTHHNALGVDRFLRIAPELYLKRLIVGGFEAVFEINRNFRNEGMDATHNPEFTSIEFYWAYKTYKDLIEITKEYFDYLFDHLNLPKRLPYGEVEIDFDQFTQIELIKSLTQIGGVPEDVVNDKAAILNYLKSHNLETKPAMNLGQLQGELFDEFVEGKLINPTFITHYPVEISPLARRNDERPELTDRFELFIAGREIANAFSELNDPIDQLERFEGQMAAKTCGDDEAHDMDEDFVTALSYGMAPTAGQGIGIDRLVMMLTNQHSIRDVLLFPAMKPIHNNQLNNGEEE